MGYAIPFADVFDELIDLVRNKAREIIPVQDDDSLMDVMHSLTAHYDSIYSPESNCPADNTKKALTEITNMYKALDDNEKDRFLEHVKSFKKLPLGVLPVTQNKEAEDPLAAQHSVEEPENPSGDENMMSNANAPEPANKKLKRSARTVKPNKKYQKN